MTGPPGETRPLSPHGALVGGKSQLHLSGFMGSGKSTVGRLLARSMLWNFLDLDALVERHAGRGIAEIFASDGEEHFRDLEAHVLRQAVQKPRAVVALGGGTPLRRRNREVIGEAAVWVWLRCTFETAWRRLQASPLSARPLLGSEAEARDLLRRRTSIYELADVVVDADAEAHEVAASALGAIDALGGHPTTER